MNKISLKIRILIVLLSIILVLSLIIVLNTNRSELIKTKISENSKINNMIEKPEGIQAYTYMGEKTDKTYEWLILNKTVNKITCKNETIATFNYDESALCHINNWLYQGDYSRQWLISPSDSDADIASFVQGYGYVVGGTSSYVSESRVTDYMDCFPVMALSKDVLVTGSGTKTDPYVISM